ncbi:MAG: kinesin motor protein cin8 [Geoglossum umbratile]|nr:MAG: kinesin motor protein cin8 [Geoglossum umbratile]
MPPHLSSGRLQSGAASPANSVASMSTLRSRSPTSGMKRKERDYDHDGSCEETNIHVVVRCRGRNEREVRENSGVVLSTTGVKGKSIELSMGPSALSNKTYTFDKVFSPAADQSIVYDEVVAPILEEMLAGYNCTIFAYGQTGTGKTYTMSGDMSDTLGLLSDSAGIIPRVLHHLFNKLENDASESSVKCSFIELYNEELRDLLSLDDGAKLKMFEDGSRKGHSATIVQGMEESHIKNAIEGIKLLQDGSHKRQVAATKCNDLSSRSHTVFTVTVYVKRTTEAGEDFVSAGKLNLVDLAGSENIQRSGAENKRAAEAGLINKSLLTLGRVINALVDKSSHIPYRESKLTRLLQDSLGGRTKTCIIATVSPAKSNLEETISTLDYAFRAKNIRNKPQVNQMISKKTLLREFTTEIEKLKSELIATRHRNGVYLSVENYEELTEESESRRILSEEQKAKIETMEVNLRNKVQELFSITSNFNNLKKDSEATRAILDQTKGLLEKTEIVLAVTRQTLAGETILRQAHQHTEEKLIVVGNELLSTLHNTVSDVGGLHSKLRRRSDLQALNRNNWKSSQAQVSDVTRLVEMKVGEFTAQHEQLVGSLSARIQGFVQDELQNLDIGGKFLQENGDTLDTSEKHVAEGMLKAKDDMDLVLEEIKTLREDVKRGIGQGLDSLSSAAGRISAEVISELDAFHSQLHASYSTLGKDFKSIFEELVKHINSQKAEADDLRRQLAVATADAVQTSATASARLDAALEGERQQSASDRKTLLSQIALLIESTAETQDARLISRIGSIQDDIHDSRSKFDVAQAKFNEGMNVWAQKENLLVEEVLKSREELKGKLKKDWTAANLHNSSIQSATKSVHEETIRIVDAQMKDIGVQMQALDEFVTRARLQNERHHETHVESLRSLSTTVKSSRNTIASHFTSNQDRIRNLENDTSGQTATLRGLLPVLDSEVRQPLTELRSNITSVPLKEYIPTGATPQKIQYQYPKSLPRTEPPEHMIGVGKGDTQHPPTDVGLSPSKSMVFNDAEDEVALLQPMDTSKGEKPTTGGLRELDVNVKAATTNADQPTITPNNDVQPPPKKQITLDGKVRKAGWKGSVVKLEGRENSLMPVLMGSTSRRLRSSPP